MFATLTIKFRGRLAVTVVGIAIVSGIPSFQIEISTDAAHLQWLEYR